MQSEYQRQQFGEPRKNPYLTQYKHEMGAKHRELRQKLGQDLAAPGSPTNPRRHSRDAIPSIDDETLEPAPAETLARRPDGAGRADDEAEASLQFFKRNLLPAASAGVTGGLSERRPSVSSSNAESQPPRSAALGAHGSKRQASSEGLPARPLPFKHTSINQSLSKKYQPMEAHAAATLPKTLAAHSRSQPRQAPTEDRVGLPDPPPAAGNLRSFSEPRASLRGERGFADSDEPKPPRPSRQSKSVNQEELQTDLQRPPSSEPFSRKPLYNSLLRAHDSIRLKVNRPKVRPKSEVQHEDTVVVDSIPLALIRSDGVNERAVDVKRSSSRKGGKKKAQDEETPVVRNFSEVRVVKIVRTENERSIGVTVKAEDGNIVVARIMAGSLADKQGALQVRDIILSINNSEVYTPEQLQELLKKSLHEDTVLMKIVPSFREELPTLCIYLRALFTYDANEDSLLPCKEVGVSFNQGDILEVVNQEDPNWWQARRVDSENLQTGLIPSQELEERRRAFVIPDYDLATRTSICGSKITRKSKKKEIYNLGQNCEFDRAELQLYEEVCRTPAFERRTLVLIGANGVGRQALKARLVTVDPDRFGTPLPHTSRLPRDGEEDGVHYHFVSREKMEEDIINGKYLEYGEYEGALYGTKLDSVREIIGAGKVCVLDCSATCLKILKTSDYLPFVAFIAAPTLDQLRYMHDYARTGNRNYTTFDRALSRQSRRARTLQDFAFDFFEDEDLQLTVEESARLFRMYENYFDIVLVNNNLEETFELLKDAINALSMAPQWIPISWIYGT